MYLFIYGVPNTRKNELIRIKWWDLKKFSDSIPLWNTKHFLNLRRTYSRIRDFTSNELTMKHLIGKHASCDSAVHVNLRFKWKLFIVGSLQTAYGLTEAIISMGD